MKGNFVVHRFAYWEKLLKEFVKEFDATCGMQLKKANVEEVNIESAVPSRVPTSRRPWGTSREQFSQQKEKFVTIKNETEKADAGCVQTHTRRANDAEAR